MSLLALRHKEGARAAFAALGLGIPQPSLGSVGIKTPSAPGLPGPARPPSTPKTTGTVPSSPTGSVGVDAAKVAFNVGMSASSHDGTGAAAGEPADTGRRQRSVIDRALQRNEDDYATSSMPLPGNVISP